MLVRVIPCIVILFFLVTSGISFGGDMGKEEMRKPLDEIFSWDVGSSGIKSYELKMSKKKYDIFFGLSDYHGLRKYRKSKFGVLDGKLLKSKFRARGLTDVHWGRYNKSLKIRMKDDDGNKKFLNLNTLHSDPYLNDLICYKIYQQEGLLAPDMELAELIVNGEYNGIKQRLENLDSGFLNRRQISLGSVYREKFAATLVSFYGWEHSDYKAVWEKQTLKKEDNYEDWIAFLQINSTKDDEIFFRYIEKYLDIDDYLKWYALTNLMGGLHNSDHNLIFVNDFKSQKFRQIGYDTEGFKGETTMPTYFYSNHFSSRILTKPEYFFKINSHIYELIKNDSFEEKITRIADKYLGTLSAVMRDRDRNKLSQVNDSTLQLDKSKNEYFFGSSIYGKGGKSLEGFERKIIDWYRLRQKFYLKEFDDVTINLNVKNIKLPDKRKVSNIVVEGLGESAVPIYIIDLVMRGGSGIRFKNITLESTNDLDQLTAVDAKLCYDKNNNGRRDEGEICIMQNLKANEDLSFVDVDKAFPLLLPKLDSTPNAFIDYSYSLWPYRGLSFVAKQHSYLLLLSPPSEANADIPDYKVKSIELESALTGKRILPNEKPLLLGSKDYVMGPMQEITIRPEFSKFTTGISSAKMKWSGLPDWLVDVKEGKMLSGVVPRIPPTEINATLDLKIGDVTYQYEINFHIKKWDTTANILSYIEPMWASFVENGEMKAEIKNKLREFLKKWYYKIGDVFHIFTDFESIWNKRGIRLDQSWVSFDVLEENEDIVWGPGMVNVEKTVVLPATSTLSIKPGTQIKISPGKGVIFHGVVKAIGEPDNKIVFTSAKGDDYFGSLVFNQWSMPGSEFEDVIVENGKDFLWKQRFYSGAMSVYNTAVKLNRVIFRNNKGDDALNAKYSNSIIESSAFHDNAADAIDLDFAGGLIRGNIFLDNGNDAIDVGSSIPVIEGNWIENSEDKAISVGEQSKPIIDNNVFYLNTVGIAVKDDAYPKISNSLFINNKTAFSMFIKKGKFNKPHATLNTTLFFSNEDNIDLHDSTYVDLKTVNMSSDRKIAHGMPAHKIYNIFVEENSKSDSEKRLNPDTVKHMFEKREQFKKSSLH